MDSQDFVVLAVFFGAGMFFWSKRRDLSYWVFLMIGWAIWQQTRNTLIAGTVLVATWIKFGLEEQRENFSIGDAMYPFAVGRPRGLVGGGCEAEGDITLTNLYRRLHNLDSIQRSQVFQFNDALAGGSYNAPLEPYVGEAYDRGMMDLKQRINEEIGRTRRGYSEMYDIPTKPLMGNFEDCHMGDCQFQVDAEGKILGIPSQLGQLPAYF
jgi:hypothetical protein